MWLGELDDEGDPIKDPWRALDLLIERDAETGWVIDMAKRLRTASAALNRISRLTPDHETASVAFDALWEIGMDPKAIDMEEIDDWRQRSRQPSANNQFRDQLEKAIARKIRERIQYMDFLDIGIELLRRREERSEGGSD